MATAARDIRRMRRRQKPRLVDPKGNPLTQHQLIEASERFRRNLEREEQVRILSRRPLPNESASVRFAMRVVEHQIVKGLWVTEIATDADGPRSQRRHGIGYMLDAIDHWGQAIAKGGWVPPPPQPAVPSGREIDAAEEAKRWIEWLDEGQAKLLRVAALTKRGDRTNRVNWGYVKSRLRLPETTPYRTLQERYDRALRTIVAELTVARISHGAR